VALEEGIMTEPREQLRLLSVFHYVLAGLSGVFSLLPLLYVALGVAVVAGKLPPDGKGPPMPNAFGWIFVGFGTVMTLVGITYSVLLVIAGRCLARARAWTFCMVMAAVSCAFFPFGTVLGVFTIIALAKSETKALFEPAGSPPGRTP
jgi:hypothetical protein